MVAVTDVAGALGGALGGSLLGGITQRQMANDARNAQIDAANRANQGLTDWRNQLQGMYSPYFQPGNDATGILSRLASNPALGQGYGGFQSSISNLFQPGAGIVQPPTGQTTGGFNPNVGKPVGGMGTGARFRSAGMDAPDAGMRGGFTGPMPGLASNVPPDAMMMRGGLGRIEGGEIASSPGSLGGQPSMPPSVATPDIEPPIGSTIGARNVQPALPMTPGADVTRPASTSPGWGGAFAQSYYNQAAGMPGDINANIAAGNRSWDPRQIMDDPGYQFAHDAAQEAVAQQMAAQGASASGGAAKFAGETAGNVANRYYGDAWNRMQQDRGFWAGRADTAFNQDMAKAQFGLGAGSQGFNQWLASQQFGLQNRQFDWTQLQGNRAYDTDLVNRQLGLLSQLSGQGLNALGQYGQFGSGVQNQMGANILGQGNAQAASAMANPWAGFGSTLSNLGGAYLGNLWGGGK